MQLLSRLYTDLPIAIKLGLGFAVLIALSATTGFISVGSLDEYGSRTEVVAKATTIEEALLMARMEEKNFLLRKDAAHVEQAAEHLETINTLATNLNDELDAEQQAILATIVSGTQEYSLLLSELAEVQQQYEPTMEQLDKTRRMLEARLSAEDQMFMAKAMFKPMQRHERDFLVNNDERALQQFDGRLKRALNSIDSTSVPDAKKDEVKGLFNEYANTFRRTAELNERTNSLEERMIAAAQRSLEASASLQEAQTLGMASERQQTMVLIITSTATAIILSIAIAWLLTRVITHPIREAVTIAKRVAGGDLRTEINSRRKDELGQLLAALAEMVSGLKRTVNQINDGAGNIATSTDQLSSITEENSRGVTEQRDQIDQVATAMNEMVATVAEVARNAEEASSAANDADDKAVAGDQAVQETLMLVNDMNQQVQQVMTRLNTLQTDTRNIGSVLDVIKSVAEQTNLLALNAAIEAARAGEQGRGFAVVADEVRSLAQRTQSSTAEIEALITSLVNSAEETVNVMETGASLANQTLNSANTTGEAIREITQAVDNITRLNLQIATAAEEQTSVAEDINQNITLIRDVSDRSADSTQQVSSSSAELARLGVTLREQVAGFTV